MPRLPQGICSAIAVAVIIATTLGCGERGSVARTAPPAPQPTSSTTTPVNLPPEENFVQFRPAVEPVDSPDVLVTSSIPAPTNRSVEDEFHSRLRQLELEAVRDTPLFTDISGENIGNSALFDELNETKIP